MNLRIVTRGIVFTTVLLFLAPVLFGQGTVAIGRSIPDPQKKMSIAQFLSNKSVVKELGLDDKAQKAIQELLTANNGDLVNLSFYGGTGMPKLGNIKARAAMIRQENESIYDDIIDPIQQDRLREIVYQIELARVGPAEALLNGFLGRDVGVEVYQKPALKIVADAAESRAKTLIKEIISAARGEVVSELSASQRERAKRLLGSDFEFVDERPTVRFEYKLPGFSVPDPGSLIATAGLAMKKSIRREIGLDPNVERTLDKLHRDARGSGPLASVRDRRDAVSKIVYEELQQQVEEMFTPSQKTRLSQLAYHVEIARIGLIRALTEGYFGKELEIDENQKTTLFEKSEFVQLKADESILRVSMAWRTEIFGELTPAQRQQAIMLLGKEFCFRETLK